MKNQDRKRASKEETEKEIREILDLKAQGWSDRQIRGSLSISARHYGRRLATLRESELFKMEALDFLNEAVHRLRYLRMKAFNDYAEWKKVKQYNAAASAFRRMVEIDTSLPKMCLDLGWSVDDLNRFYSKKDESKTNRIPESEDELRQEYKRIVESEC